MTLLPITEDPRWQNVLDRDAAADGRFVYAVRTTGIYCRPSCPSRRAQPRHVSFFPSVDAAREAGFRACLRCHPDGQSPATAMSELVAAVCRIIEASDTMPTLEELAKKAGISPYHLHRRFRAITGLTPKEWAVSHRDRRLREALSEPGSSVTSAIFEAGFASSGRFYERADAVLGMRPTDWRRGGAAQEIRFATAPSSLGIVLIAQTARGICAITLGDEAEPLIADLARRFPKAQLIEAGPRLSADLARVVSFVEAPQIGLDLPLDIRGTAFQERVWQALRQIPAGETLSYAAVARSIGAPKAVRAVAQACAANRLAVAIPCHRVLREDGALSGYRWGVGRKRELLAREGRG